MKRELTMVMGSPIFGLEFPCSCFLLPGRIYLGKNQARRHEEHSGIWW